MTELLKVDMFGETAPLQLTEIGQKASQTTKETKIAHTSTHQDNGMTSVVTTSTHPSVRSFPTHKVDTTVSSGVLETGLTQIIIVSQLAEDLQLLIQLMKMTI